MKNFSKLLFLVFLFGINFAHAASFVISGDETNAQTLDANNETGLINAGATLSTTSNSITVNNVSGAQVTNNGTIASTSDSVFAILGTGANSTSARVVNNGAITLQGSFSAGIALVGSNAVVINSGDIVAQGSVAAGVILEGDNSVMINSGTISVTGANNPVAVNLDSIGSSDNTLVNTGTISATESAVLAIVGSTGDQTIFLGKGSRITGTINLNTGNDTITATGNGISTRVATSDTNNFVVSPGVAGVVVGNSIHTIDPTSVAALTVSANNLVKTIGGEVNSRVNVEEGKAWTKVFGSEFERGDDTKNLSYNHDYNGVIAGYEYGNNFGVILGVSTGEIKTDSQSFKSNVDSAFIGFYKDLEIANSTFLNTNLIAGYEQYKNERTVIDNINGTQVARSDVNNLFISPSVELEHRIKLHEVLQIVPNASANYTSSYFGSSAETGATASNVATEKRDVHILNLKAGISAIATIMKNYQINLGAGLDSRKISEDNASASISGNNFTFNTNNDKNVSGKYFDLGLNFIGFEDLTFGVNASTRSADGGEDQKSANLSGSYRF